MIFKWNHSELVRNLVIRAKAFPFDNELVVNRVVFLEAFEISIYLSPREFFGIIQAVFTKTQRMHMKLAWW